MVIATTSDDLLGVVGDKFMGVYSLPLVESSSDVVGLLGSNGRVVDPVMHALQQVGGVASPGRRKGRISRRRRQQQKQ